ncbi:MAG: DNA polymerase III epsilon subunit-like protein [Rhodothermales bacterium]|jgi:DNA polymerase III epsilon subunit-like protein
MNDETVVWFDFETGGLEPHHPSIQLAAVAVRGGVEVASFERKIQFREADSQAEALALNSYDPEQWRDAAVPEGDAIKDFIAFLRAHADTELVSARTGRPYNVALVGGHNVVGFDIPRLRAAAKGAFLPCCWWYPLDTYQRAIWHAQENGYRPANFQLSTLAEHFGIASEGAHDALADVRMCAALADALAATG